MFFSIARLLFDFSTVLEGYSYGTRAWKIVFGIKSTMFYKTVFVLFIIVGSTADLDTAWDISNTLNSIMAIPNLIGVL